MVLWDDERKTCAEIAKFSRKDAERYPDYNRFLHEVAAFVRAIIWKTPPASLGPRSAKDMLDLGWKLRRMGPMTTPSTADPRPVRSCRRWCRPWPTRASRPRASTS